MSRDIPKPPRRVVDLRRERRVAYRLPVGLFHGREEVALVTQDVSHHGLFIPTERMPAVRHLVRLRLLLPPYGRELLAHGMVVHNVGGGHDGGSRPQTPGHEEGSRPQTPGVGIQLYGMDRAAQTVWSNFVTRAEEGELRAEEEPAADAISFLPPEVPGQG